MENAVLNLLGNVSDAYEIIQRLHRTKLVDHSGRDEFSRWIRATRGCHVTDFTENLHTLRDASNANDADKSTTLSTVRLQLEERRGKIARAASGNENDD